MATASRRYSQLAARVGHAAQASRAATVARRFGCSRGFVRYHSRKHSDPTFHTGPWGGSRGNAHFGPLAEMLLHVLLWQEIKADPLRTVCQFGCVLRDNGWDVSDSWVQRCFARWGFSLRKPNYKNINKFKATNIIYYCSFTMEVVTLPWLSLKYLDESSFDTRKLQRPRGRAPTGRPLHVARGSGPHGSSYTITVLTSLTNPSGFVCSDPRHETNTAADFLNFIITLVLEGHLVAGDVLVCDNASIHYSAEIQAPLDILLLFVGVRLLFLPTYSPELNPCELIFAQIKRHVRTNRTSRHLLADVLTACTEVTWLNVLNYYGKCIYDFES